MSNSMNINELNKSCLDHIESIAWDPNTSDIEKIHSIQGLLYSWGASLDHKTDQMFGDDDAHINSPNMRRC